jgi:hypothetical protein
MGGLGGASSLGTVEDMLRRSGAGIPLCGGLLCRWGTRYEGWAHKQRTLIYLVTPSTRNLQRQSEGPKGASPSAGTLLEGSFWGTEDLGEEGSVDGRYPPSVMGGPFTGNSESWLKRGSGNGASLSIGALLG